MVPGVSTLSNNSQFFEVNMLTTLSNLPLGELATCDHVTFFGKKHSQFLFVPLYHDIDRICC